MTGVLANTSAVVLAGGFGTRIRHLLPELPKPMAPVCGRPFVEWVVRYLAQQGIGQVILSTGHLGERIEAHFSQERIPGINLICVREREPLGTGGGFLNAVRLSQTRPAFWLVLNGDSLAFARLDHLAAAMTRPEIAGVLLGVEVENASRYGTISFDETGLLQKFEEKQRGRGVINAGVYLFRAEALTAFPATIPLSFEKEIFPALLASGAALKVCVCQAPFLDIGTPESLPQAAAFIKSNLNQFA
jgi:NDP-sugar pyrophosphorylase family protein